MKPGFVKDKVVLVTGAGGGIGREFALALGREGAKVVVNDLGASLDGVGRDSERAHSVVDEIKAAGGEAIANGESVADWDAAARMVQLAVDTYGRIDCVINNAGILRDRFFFNMSKEDWHQVIDVHLHGTFYVSRAAATHFKAQQSGAYVHIVSTSGLIGNLAQANYSAAKLGIAALSKSIAMDMAKFNVRSNCISPFAWSRMISSIPTETPEQQARVERLQKMESSKIAPLAVYLASDQGAGVSGQLFAVRANEIFLMSQSRPIRAMHTDQGWTPESIADRAMPAFKPSFYKLDRSQDVFDWDPV
jgi:NAD(P)-dependent dehydrogenase (short-subunit alcohol dehydrogenase family)